MLVPAGCPSLGVRSLYEKEASDTVFNGREGIKLGTNHVASKHVTPTNKKHAQTHEIVALVNGSRLTTKQRDQTKKRHTLGHPPPSRRNWVQYTPHYLYKANKSATLRDSAPPYFTATS